MCAMHKIQFNPLLKVKNSSGLLAVQRVGKRSTNLS
jgi:hypothetical protein